MGSLFRMQSRLFTATKNNQLLDEITTSMIKGQVALDLDSQGSKMTFKADMRKSIDVRPLGTFVAPFVGVTYADGSSVYEQVGLFVLIPAPASHLPGGTIQSLDGRDLCWLLDANQTPITVNDTIGTDPIASVLTALNSTGYRRHNIPLSSTVYTKHVSFGPGTSRLKRINERLKTASYYNLWFDRKGIAVSVPYYDLATAEPAVTYSSANGSQVVPPISDEPDMTRLANRVVVLGGDPSLSPIKSVRENGDQTSPTSWYNIGNPTQDPTQGNWITRTVEDSTIQTQAQADAMSEELLRNGSSYYRKLTLRTLPDPSRNPREVYELDITNRAGDVIADGKWWCSGWTLSLDANNPVMIHNLNRVEAFTMSVGS
jgi:hypothetical protein